jgi:uncharacterized protein (TIGR02391 family)
MTARPHPSIPALLRELWSNDFFRSYKGMEEIGIALEKSGYNYPKESLRVALIRSSLKSGFLTCKRIGGKQMYVQKGPPTSGDTKRNDRSELSKLHPEIRNVSDKQFKNKLYKEAIQNAMVEVIHLVKKKAGYPKKTNGSEYDGDDLMNVVFGCDNGHVPIIKLNDLSTSLDRAEQRGLMYLFKGLVGIRDKKAHLNFVQNDPRKTLEYLALCSLLIRLLDDSSIS